MKKIIGIVLAVLFAFSLTSCGSQTMKDVYTIDEIYSDEAYGFFVKKGDNFYPVQFLDDHSEFFQWYVGEIKIPKVTAKTPLVAVYNKSEDMPTEFFINKYNDLGYTIGANVGIGEDNNSMWMNTYETCPNSNIEAALASQDVDEVVELEAINDSKPFSNVDTDVNILTGLEKGKYYDLKLYSGTKSLHASAICADTRVFKFIEKTTLDDPLKKTHGQYFIVNLPTNLHKGFYDINGMGMFQL